MAASFFLGGDSVEFKELLAPWIRFPDFEDAARDHFTVYSQIDALTVLTGHVLDVVGIVFAAAFPIKTDCFLSEFDGLLLPFPPDRFAVLGVVRFRLAADYLELVLLGLITFSRGRKVCW